MKYNWKRGLLMLATGTALSGYAQETEPTETRDSIPSNGIEKLPLLRGENPLTLQRESGTFILDDSREAARYDSLWLRELHATASRFEELQSLLQNPDSLVNSKSLPTGLLQERLRHLDAKTPFNIAYNPALESVINTFLTRKRGLMERMLTASQFYFPMFEQALDKYDLPLEIKYLAIVESALNPRARSRVGATGLWQFMYGTGKMYGLEVNSYVDERSDPIRATEAACQYLSKLHQIFGDWDLALAAYNSGPGNVNKAIRRSGGYTNYWNIRPFLPRETAGYVPAFQATMYLFEYAAEHGLAHENIARPYFDTDTVHIRQTITFDQISALTGVSNEELEMLNPAYKLEIIPTIPGKEYYLRLPRRAIGKFVNNEAAIYAQVKQELEKQEKPLPELVRAQDRIRYRVRSGDYLGKIAARYGVRVSQIKKWNGLRSNNLRVGQRLTIYPRKPVVSNTTTNTGSGSRSHLVRKGDSLWNISKRYPGVTVDKLKAWNNLSGNNLVPGTRLKLCECSS